MKEKDNGTLQETKGRIDLGSDKKSNLKQHPEKVIAKHNQEKKGKTRGVT